ncbi:MAG: DUF2442 domain-containing protein, partial [Burkholderiaceae bacterium]
MIKIIRAIAETDYSVRLTFSDGTEGVVNLEPKLRADTVLTRGLRAQSEFRRFFLDMGALCWPNGLEFSPAALHSELRAAGL